MSFKKIKKGDVVDIIFPATHCSSDEIQKIKNYVKYNLELTPRIPLESVITIDKTLLKNSEFPSGSALQRFQQLEQALNSNSKIIWCGRGGYGSGDLLPYLDKIQKITQNKIFIGFSDIVSIGNFLQQKWRWQIIAAPVLLQLARGDIIQSAENELYDLLFNNKITLNYKLIALNQINKPIPDAEIAGGCLSVLCSHFGGSYQIDLHNKILFLEDEGEDGERLDRYFRQIIELILKNKSHLHAIILGNFEQENIHGTPRSHNIQIALKRLIERIDENQLNIPVLQASDKNLGHSSAMRPVILGSITKINLTKENGYIMQILA